MDNVRTGSDAIKYHMEVLGKKLIETNNFISKLQELREVLKKDLMRNSDLLKQAEEDAISEKTRVKRLNALIGHYVYNNTDKAYVHFVGPVNVEKETIKGKVLKNTTSGFCLCEEDIDMKKANLDFMTKEDFSKALIRKLQQIGIDCQGA